MTAARPSAVPVAPAREVPYQRRTTGTRTQLKAAQRTTSVAVSWGGAVVRGVSGVGCGPGMRAPWGWVTVFNACSTGRSLYAPVLPAAG